MSRRALVLTVALFTGVTILAFLLAGAPGRGAGPSAISPSSAGLIAARRYLDLTGREVKLLDETPAVDSRLPALLLAFPSSRNVPSIPPEVLDRFFLRGGKLLWAYSGESPEYPEKFLAESLDLSFRAVGEPPPLWPARWWVWRNAEWRLNPVGSDPGRARAVVIHAPREVPVAPPRAEVLYRGEGDVPAVFSFPRRRGHVFVLPVDAISNGRFGREGNADLLETVAAAAGLSIAFDEQSHGMRARSSSGASVGRAALDLLLVQLVCLYGLAAWALSRRFGPVWQERPLVTGSSASFLMGLATTHWRLKHARDAAARLLDRIVELDPRREIPGEWRERASRARDVDLVALARAVSSRIAERRE